MIRTIALEDATHRELKIAAVTSGYQIKQYVKLLLRNSERFIELAKLQPGEAITLRINGQNKTYRCEGSVNIEN
jgi:hypothetical protein